ncbi:MAG: RNA 2',3'-cyclic phosphodiesterase [Gammaproteobacteria bacterium]|nr:RNA 2',3'-cyclic phosphodiesterase [Gammaproteobacteria bacterium]
MNIAATPPVQRLFFALWPDEALREQLRELRRPYLMNKKNGKPVHCKNLHITLSFLGNIEASRRQCLERVADSIQAQNFILRLDRIGYWPRPRILWAGASSAAGPLQTLVEELDHGLEACGMVPESRAYKAHLTLARKYRNGPLKPLTIQPLDWTVSDFALVESHTHPDGVQYKVLRRWPFDTDFHSVIPNFRNGCRLNPVLFRRMGMLAEAVLEEKLVLKATPKLTPE